MLYNKSIKYSRFSPERVRILDEHVPNDGGTRKSERLTVAEIHLEIIFKNRATLGRVFADRERSRFRRLA